MGAKVMDDHSVQSRTYDYLRLSLLAVLLVLSASVVLEWREAKWCLQTSISAYYYTPVQAVFVGGLVAVGVGMLVLYGRDAIEDAFLNLSGLFAPVVAFVPTRQANACSLPAITASGATIQDANSAGVKPVVVTAQSAIDNNMSAFLAVVGVALVVLMVRSFRGSRKDPAPKLGEATQEKVPYLLSYIVAGVAWFVGAVAFWRQRQTFYEVAHGVSAVLLFLCIIVVVFEGARRRGKRAVSGRAVSDQEWKKMPLHERLKAIIKDRYAWVGTSMIVATVGIVVYEKTVGWEHWILAVEASLLVLFAVFWALQTWEHWSGRKTAEGDSGTEGSEAIPQDSRR